MMMMLRSAFTRRLGATSIFTSVQTKTARFLSAKVFVGNLPFDIDSNLLQNHMEQCGQVVNIDLFRNRETGKFMGHGLVEYKTEQQARDAVEKLFDLDFGGRPLFIRADRPAETRDDPRRTLIVENLSPMVSWQDLKDHMKASVGDDAVQAANVMDNSKGERIGTVVFRTKEYCEQALTSLQRTKLEGKEIRLRQALAAASNSDSSFGNR